GLRGMAEEFDLHLLEFPRPEREIARRDLIAKTLADLGDSKGNMHPTRVADVLEIEKDTLRRFRPQERRIVLGSHGADDGLEHQIEFSGLRELTFFILTRMTARLQRTRAGGEVIRAEAALALATVHHHVVEQIVVSRTLPDLRVHDNRAVQTGHL